MFLDLDETLILDALSTDVALQTTLAEACILHGLGDPASIGQAVLGEAEGLWAAGPHAPYCRRIGISASEGLWASFALGDDPDTAGLRGFAPAYRREAWRLGVQGLRQEADGDVVAELAERFVWERGRRQIVYPEVLPALGALRCRGLQLVLVTNGDRDLQRRKAVASGLLPLFDHVVISGQVGVGKPDPDLFRHALRLCAVSAQEAVMVGDSEARDILGGQAAGLRTVWIDRWGEASDLESPPRPWGLLPDLAGLPTLLSSF